MDRSEPGSDERARVDPQRAPVNTFVTRDATTRRDGGCEPPRVYPRPLTMTADFERIHRELGEIRRRARTIEGGAVRDDELKLYAREIVETADRLVRMIEDIQREQRRASRSDDRGQ
jgi:hypothetical protein